MTRGAQSNVEVLFLVPAPESKGGIGRLALYLRREFDEISDVSFRVVATRVSERRILKHLSTIPALASFAWRCAGSRGRIVHLNVAPRGSTYRKIVFWLAARACGAKTVLHLHGSGYDQFFERQPAIARRTIQRFFQAADHVVVLGAYWHRFVIDRLGVPHEQVSIIDNGVPEPGLSREARWEPPLIVTMGLVGERKGTDVLVEALAALPPSLEWQAVIGGDGEVEKYCSAADARGLRDRLRFLGWVGEEEVGLWLDRGAIFVLPSRAENQPVAILEAMARGLPVVATAIGAIPEQVVDAQTGILVPPGEAEPLKAALQALLESPERRSAFGAAGRDRYRSHFSIRHCAAAFRALYQRLAADGAPPVGSEASERSRV